MHIFVDESGDLGTTGPTEYFVIGMVFCHESTIPGMNEKINEHNDYLWANGWPKQFEIKAANLYSYKQLCGTIGADTPAVNPRLYLQRIYRDINELDIKVGFLIHNPDNQGSVLKCLHKEKIYNFLSKKLYQMCFHYMESPLVICVDQRNITLVKKQKHIDRSTQRLNLGYIGYIDHELSYQFASRRNMTLKVDIEFQDSSCIKGLQVADYLCWATRKKYEGKPFWANLTSRIEKIEEKDNF